MAMAMHDKCKVFVKLTSGRNVLIPVRSWTFTNDTMKELCQKVAKEENAPAEIITLTCGDTVEFLKRGDDMRSYGVREEMLLKVQLLTKETLNVHLHLPGTPEEMISVEIYNTSCNSVLRTKAIAARPLLDNKYMSFHIGDMTLNQYICVYEDCIQDWDHIMVKCPQWEWEEKEKQELLNNLASSMTSKRKVDIVFSFDTSGSMNDILHRVQKHLRESVTHLITNIPDIRIGLIAHSDYSDEYRYVLRKHKLSSNMAKLVKFVDKTTGSFTDRPCSWRRTFEEGRGSSDVPEFACYEWMLRHANGLSWREDAAKALVIIGDVVPHPTSYTNLKINWRDELDKLCEKDVQVYGVRGMYHDKATCFYAYMAKKSGGAHIKFEHFSWITDMLIAVWYRASGNDQLKAYVDKLKKEGRMTDEMMDVMRLLEKKPEEEVKDEEKEERRKEEEEAADEEEAEITQPNAQRPHEEDYEPHGRLWYGDLQKWVPAAWWDATLDQADSSSYNYIYSMNYWTRNGTYRIYNLPSALRKSLRLKTLRRGCSLM